MAELWEKHIHDRLNDLENYLLDKYKREHPKKEIDYAAYEKEFRQRFRNAMHELPLLVTQATSRLNLYRGKGG